MWWVILQVNESYFTSRGTSSLATVEGKIQPKKQFVPSFSHRFWFIITVKKSNFENFDISWSWQIFTFNSRPNFTFNQIVIFGELKVKTCLDQEKTNLDFFTVIKNSKNEIYFWTTWCRSRAISINKSSFPLLPIERLFKSVYRCVIWDFI